MPFGQCGFPPFAGGVDGSGCRDEDDDEQSSAPPKP